MTNIIETIEEDVVALFHKEKPTVVAFFAPAITATEQYGVEAATNAVAVGESTPGTGLIKMEAALAAFAATFAAKEIPYVESFARMLIEVALQKLRALVGTPTPAQVSTGLEAPAAPAA